MILTEAIHKATGMLEDAGFDNSRWQAKILVAHTASIQMTQLYLQSNTNIDQKLQNKLFRMVEERISGVPLQHVIGEWDFYGRTFKVDGRALIPRPETELLVEFITQAKLPTAPHIMDVGTGSGVIGISLALELPDSKVVGTDISPEAIELAGENKQLLRAENYSTVNCHLSASLHLVTGTLPEKKWDVIVANLPYIPSKDISALQSEVKDYDPPLALDGGTGGTLLILELVTGAPDLIKAGGMIVLETGYDQAVSVPSFFQEKYWTNVKTHKDLAGNYRMVTAIRR